MKLNLRCLLGNHTFSDNAIFEMQAAIFKGGYCSRCKKTVVHKFLYNAWGEEIEHEHAIELTGVNPQLVEDLESGKYTW